ncbi:hypothetical protein BGZ76_001454 [Entomortierella beljakovae]|nr:hypothetical protein BGZ76_001454 [Entomortierella beljakovae]
MLQLARQRFAAETNIMFYSDGSLINNGTDNVSTAFGVVVSINYGAVTPAINGKVLGYASSAIAELCGVLAAIIICPRDVQVTIYLDNSSVVQNFQTLVKGRRDATTRQKLRSAEAQWWAMVQYAYLKQGEKVTVKWVRGHAGNLGNEAADMFAKAGHRTSTGVWQLNPSQHHDMICHAQFGKQTEDIDLRQILKLQSVSVDIING